MHIKADIKLRREYTCICCGRQALGDTEYFEFERSESPVQVQMSLVAFVQSLKSNGPPAKMPVGWSSYLDGIYCGSCK